MTLKSRVLLVASAAILVVGSVVGSSGYVVDRESQARFAEVSIQGNQALWNSIVANRIDRMTAGGRSLTRNRDLSKALQGGDTTAARDSANATFNRLSTSKVITGLMIADKRGRALFGEPETLDHTLGQRLLADAAQSKEVRHGLIADQQNRPYLMVALPLYHRRQLSGVGGYVLALDSLADEMAKSSEAVAVLMSREGRPFYSTTEQESADVRRHDMGTELATLWERLRIGEREYSATYVPMSGYDGQPVGQVLTLKDYSESFAQQTTVQAVSYTTVAIALALALAGLYWQIRQSFLPIERVAQAMGQIANGDLRGEISIDSNNEITRILRAMVTMRDTLRSMLSNISDTTNHLSKAATDTSVVTEQTRSGALRQQGDTDAVATAMTEMTATVGEVAQHASSAAEAAREADEQAREGQQVAKHTVETIRGLANGVESAATVIDRLREHSEAIGQVLDVIRGIAEQTNLLALNAAIEAARAGEQGRGFAVVADEVRTLANRTQASTGDINDMIEKLQNGAHEAVQVMDRSRGRAEDSVSQVGRTGESLQAITQAVARITEMNMQIATAAQEQEHVANSINEKLVSISGIAEQTAGGASRTAEAGEDLSRLADDLKQLVARFRL